MAKLKSISATDLQKVITHAEAKIKAAKTMREGGSYQDALVSLGFLESSMEHVIKQLKGEYPIY